jgi:hypothetical protein
MSEKQPRTEAQKKQDRYSFILGIFIALAIIIVFVFLFNR